MRAILTYLTVLAVACGGPDAEPDAGSSRRVDGPRQEPIAVRIGGREVRVQCGVECAELTGELSRLHGGCMHDPMSTPHLVAESGALVSLGCCTQARTAYEQACGLEGQGRCESAWGARCESGDSGEAAP